MQLMKLMQQADNTNLFISRVTDDDDDDCVLISHFSVNVFLYGLSMPT